MGPIMSHHARTRTPTRGQASPVCSASSAVRCADAHTLANTCARRPRCLSCAATTGAVKGGLSFEQLAPTDAEVAGTPLSAQELLQAVLKDSTCIQ